MQDDGHSTTPSPAISEHRRILLVEDNPGDARLIQMALDEAGTGEFALTHAARMDQALALLSSESFDGVLLDLSLPDSSGTETLTRVRSEAPGLPIIVLTGLDDENLGRQLIQQGAQDYLVKGETEPKLLVRSLRYSAKRKHMEAELRRANAELDNRVAERTRELERANIELRQLSQAVEQSPASILITDTEGDITYVNPAFTHVSGYTREEVIGNNPRILKSGRTAPEVYEELWQTITSGREWRGELENKKRNGELLWEMTSISPIKAPDGTITHFLGIKEDVTELKLARERLQHSQKMEAVGQLTGGIAHDFNNILAVILGNLELLGPTIGEHPRSEKRVHAAINATMRGADLTKRLLAFSRRQTLEPQVIDVNDLVSGMDELLRRTLGETIELQTALAGEVCSADVDPGQLESAILNLAINARDAMAEGGGLTIETARVRFDEDYITSHPDVIPGQYVMVAVTDTGTGMPPDVAAKVFEPFFTTKEEGRGTGLGLSMVYGFIKQSKGHVNVYSEPGHGTSVKLYLPEVVGAKTQVDKQETPGSTSHRAATILVVEDEKNVREVAVAYLQNLGYRVLETGSGPETLGLLDQQRPGQRIDLLFSDVVMPGGMSGPELAAKVRERYPDLKVLFTSGYPRNAFDRQNGEQLDTSLLTKPYRGEELARKVRELLGD